MSAAGAALRRRYQARISGPLLDRIDLHIEVPAVSAADLVLPQAAEGSAEVRERVTAARRIQIERYAALRLPASAPMPNATARSSKRSPPPIAPASRSCARRRTRFRSAPAATTGPPRRPHPRRPRRRGEGRTHHIAEALSYRGETLRRAQEAA